MSSNEKYVDSKRKKAKLNNKLWNDFRHWVAFNPKRVFFVNLLSSYDQYRFKKVGKDPRRKKITKETQLVIDGYRSSANSYLLRCLQQIIKESDFCYADHHHSPAMIIRAVEHNIPVLLCIRKPLDVCVSGARRWSMWSVEESLQHYETFYSLLVPYIDEMVVSDFHYSIKNPLEVFSFLNESYDLGLDMSTIGFDSALAERPGKNQKEIEEEKRREKIAKQKLTKDFLANGDQELLVRCEAIYNDILSNGSNVLKLEER